MKNSPSSLIAPHVQAFFGAHLTQHKRVSPQTLASMRDSFRLLLQFLHQATGVEPALLRIADLNAPAILNFLDHLENERANSVRSRNIRLCAIRSFMRLVALRDPESLNVVAAVLAIPVKREDRKLIGYLTREEIEAILAAPDRSRRTGRRDHALLLTMYNTGARVSEMTALRQQDVKFGERCFLQIQGKGRKERTVPVWSRTAKTLRDWFAEGGANPSGMAFPNARGSAMARDGVEYILRKAASTAVAKCPSLGNKRLSPHLIRHTTATHLLQSGVDISVIALWLGHESIETTHQYVEADLRTKEKALEKLPAVKQTGPRFSATDDLLRFLNSL